MKESIKTENNIYPEKLPCIYCGGEVGAHEEEDFFDSNGYKTNEGMYAHYWTTCKNQNRPMSEKDIEYREFWREMINPRYCHSVTKKD